MACRSANAVAAVVAVCTAVLATACAVRSPGAARFPEFVEYEGREIEEVDFDGAAPFSEDTLQTLIETRETRCRLLFLPFCLPFTQIGQDEHHLDLGILSADVARLEAFYRRAGFFGTRVRPAIEPMDDNVHVIFVVERGDSIILDSLAVVGIDTVLPEDFEAQLPLQEGQLFDLGDFARSAEMVESALLARGHAYAEVLRNYGVDTLRDRAVAEIEALPGPQVRVDSIIVVGAGNLGRRGALRQLAFRETDLLQSNRLVESQRNLFSLEIVQLATVTVAPDSLQLTPDDSTTATVLVSIAEAPVHLVETAIGYGTVDCFRADARWQSRSFFGGARRLTIDGSVEKVGIANPLNFGLEGSLCRAFLDDPFRGNLDYRFAAELVQPWFLTPRNQLTAIAFDERQSEPTIYERQSRGAGVSILHRLGPRSGLSGAIDIARGRTLASDAILCLAFQVCLPEDIEELSQPKWRNALSSSWFNDGTDVPLDPTSGHLLRTTLSWATHALGSDLSFRRWTGEGSIYLEVRPQWVAAFRVRSGGVFGARIPQRLSDEVVVEDFLPPEERFFAGGASTVRGFERNGLGPGVYVASEGVRDTLGALVPHPDARIEFVPIGGTSVAVVNAELRMPAPFLRDNLRFAVFVDAGALNTQRIWDLGHDEWRVTPGVGLRIQTPVGPTRLDIAYNAYGGVTGPFLVPDPDQAGLIRFTGNYRRSNDSLWRRFRVHIAVGQPF